MNNTLSIVKDKSLTYHQKVVTLAREAENSLNILNISEEAEKLINEGIICTLFEGNAPYRPRYIVPDYDKFLKNGSEFLNLKPPKDLLEAVNNLLILYKHVPSITTFPVYLGQIDKLLDPFIENKDEAYKIIKMFLIHIDRTLTDSFVHANIGPEETVAGELILKAERELKNSVPNLTLKYCENITPDNFALEAIKTGLEVAKPSFANHNMFKSEFGEDYGIVSCYNGLHIGGGSHTLVRLNLSELSRLAKDDLDFIENVLPNAAKVMNELIDERIRFIVEESNFFESNFLVKEKLLYKDRFTSMFGIFGLAECVNNLLNVCNLEEKFGHSDKANKLGLKIIEKLNDIVKKHYNPHCKITNNNFLLHSQVGIDTDKEVSPGCRIPIGDEPELIVHLQQASKYHKYFPSGIGDIFSFDSTTRNNLSYVLDIIKGSIREGMRMFSLYSKDSDLIRITGYLVKKSDVEKLKSGKQALHDTVVLGLGSIENQRVLERKVRSDDKGINK